jgi:putative ABC transport system permease protein
MSAVWTIVRSQFVNNKIKNNFVALIILLSTVLLGVAAVVIANTGDQLVERHTQTNGSHQVLMMDQGLHDPTFVQEWWSMQEGVDVSPLLSYQVVSGMDYEGGKIDKSFRILRTPEEELGVDNLIMSDGSLRSTGTIPAPKTVWIPTALANDYGIAVGDTVTFGVDERAVPFVVGDIVINVPEGDPMTTMYRIWLNEGDYQQYFTTGTGNDAYLLNLRYADESRVGEYWALF